VYLYHCCPTDEPASPQATAGVDVAAELSHADADDSESDDIVHPFPSKRKRRPMVLSSSSSDNDSSSGDESEVSDPQSTSQLPASTSLSSAGEPKCSGELLVLP